MGRWGGLNVQVAPRIKELTLRIKADRMVEKGYRP